MHIVLIGVTLRAELVTGILRTLCIRGGHPDSGARKTLTANDAVMCWK